MVTPETETLIRASIVADVWRIAEPMTWRRAANRFRWAQPRAGEFLGRV